LFDCAAGPAQEMVHGFVWLEDLRAYGRELARVHARALIADWIGRKHKRGSPALASAIMARRLMSWIRHLPFYLEGASDDFCRLLFRSMSRHIRELQYRAAFHRRSPARLAMTLALCHASIGLRGLEDQRTQFLPALAELIERSLLPDGGHVSRSPAELCDLLLDLLPLRAACEQSRIPLPAKLNAAIERMLPMLRFFTHGDGGIALFQGAPDPRIDSCRAVFAADPVSGRPVSHASHSGYVRLTAGATTVLIDAGLPAEAVVNDRAALSPLAFELSDGAERLVSNCGSPGWGARAAISAARLPEAHSTATLNVVPERHSTARWLARRLPRSNRACARVEARVESSPVGTLFEGSHNAYLAAAGCEHARTLFLSAAGSDLRGEDRFRRIAVRGATEFTIRFHLHPAVKATLSKDGKTIMLVSSNRAAWRFSARGPAPRLEPSICFAREGRHRSTLQIVMRGRVGDLERVNWAFKKIERRPPAQAAIEAPELPL
jgi:uncharacterized heparinase superfamily protein